MKASAKAILVTDKPWGVDFGNVADIFSPADDPGYLHEEQNSHTRHHWMLHFSAVVLVELAK